MDERRAPVALVKMLVHQINYLDANGYPGVANALLTLRGVDFRIVANKDLRVELVDLGTSGIASRLSLVGADAPPTEHGDAYIADGF